MKISVLKEKSLHEKRVAAVPETVKKYIKLGYEVCIESGAGEEASFSDQEYEAAGAKVSKIPLEIIADADIVLKVQPSSFNPKKDTLEETEFMKTGAILVSFLSPHSASSRDLFQIYSSKNITSIAMELIPRITRAQEMDALSSQSNLMGYKAVIDAASEFDKAFPMMMTAAGTINPAKVMILGAGVAGLQAIATARRLGAVVCAFDVRTTAKEQVESLGAKFIQVDQAEDGSGQGGYAKEMSEEYKKKQSELIHNTIKSQDIIITTALIPGVKAPILITKEMIKDMKPGSIIVDLAAPNGGNCEYTKIDTVVNHNDIKILGYSNYPSRISSSASKLYSQNLFNLVKLMTSENQIKLNLEDEILRSAVLTHAGKIINPILLKE